MIKDNKIITFIFLICFFSEEVLHAQERLEIVGPTESEVANEPTFEQKMIEKNITISNWFDSMAEGVDLFLVGKRVIKTRNQSNISIENTTYSRESENLLNLTSLSVNPRLPNLEAYWNLKFTTYDDQALSKRNENGYARRVPRETNYGATLGFFRKLRDVRVAFQPRVELQDPLRVSHSLAFESVVDYKKFEFNPKFEFFANATKGVGISQALNFHFVLSNVLGLTFINEGEYEDRIHRYSVTNGVSLGQVISDISGLDYGISFYSHNQPNYHLDAYSLSVGYSHIIYRNILDYSLIPHFDFTREEEFRGFFGVIFKLRVHF